MDDRMPYWLERMATALERSVEIDAARNEMLIQSNQLQRDAMAQQRAFQSEMEASVRSRLVALEDQVTELITQGFAAMAAGMTERTESTAEA